MHERTSLFWIYYQLEVIELDSGTFFLEAIFDQWIRFWQWLDFIVQPLPIKWLFGNPPISMKSRCQNTGNGPKEKWFKYHMHVKDTFG